MKKLIYFFRPWPDYILDGRGFINAPHLFRLAEAIEKRRARRCGI